MKKTLCLFMFSLLIAGCGTHSYIDLMMKVNKGMSKDEVLGLLGSPKNRSFDTVCEKWEYWFYSAGEYPRNRICIITFDGEKVSEMESFFHIPTPPVPVVNVESKN